MSSQWCLEGWYSDWCILSELLPAPRPNSCSSKMQILLVRISPEFFSSPAVEKIYFCLLETEHEVTFLHQGRRAGSSPVICEDHLRSRCPVTGGISCRTGETAAASQCWVTVLLSLQDLLLQKHRFHHYHHFLRLSRHLMFCFLSPWFWSRAALASAELLQWFDR